MSFLFKLAQSILFRLPAESSHDLTLRSLGLLEACHLNKLLSPKIVSDPFTIMGLNFSNRVGLAAGLDKNAESIDALATLGFGFIEVGTVTPKPQAGNDKPRLFRLPSERAIINRMGFNNHGVDALVERINQSKYTGILGVNIGKNKTTDNNHAIDDYLFCLKKVYSVASYITINVSSPNTQGLRELQEVKYLSGMLDQLKRCQQRLTDTLGAYKPILVKLAPDLDDEQIKQISELMVEKRIDGLIIGNTSIDHSPVASHKHENQSGGLSGAPIKKLSDRVLQKFRHQLQGEIPIVGVGGIDTAQGSVDKINKGADLVQIYTGFIYSGPELIHQSASRIKQLC